jgi:hypothetical protein
MFVYFVKGHLKNALVSYSAIELNADIRQTLIN